MSGARVVIVGGGFGGLTLARALKGAALRVTLVDRMNHHLFQPLLYQVATAGLSPADIAYPIRSALRNQENARVLLGEVTSVDWSAREIVLHDGARVPYDFLVVAAGASTNYFGHDADWKAHTLGLKSIDDAIGIRRHVLLAFEAAEREPDAEARGRLLTFAVIGGGPTGIETSGALAELSHTVMARDFRVIDPTQTRVVLIERASQLLPSFGPELGRKARTQLEELGVEVRLDAEVTAIDASGVEFCGERLEAGTVLWTAGVQARSLGRALGVELDRTGRIVVEKDCSIPGHPEAFAIGDIAAFTPEGETNTLPGLAPVAMQQARFVARLLARKKRDGARPTFRYRDKGLMATVGRSRAVAQTGGGHLKLSGLIAWLAWLFVHLWYLIGFRNRVSVLLNWFWAYLTYRRGARLITGAESWRLLPKPPGPGEPDG
jgi:NADH:quinone reductase (non-electrogenic)